MRCSLVFAAPISFLQGIALHHSFLCCVAISFPLQHVAFSFAVHCSLFFHGGSTATATTMAW